MTPLTWDVGFNNFLICAVEAHSLWNVCICFSWDLIFDLCFFQYIFRILQSFELYLGPGFLFVLAILKQEENLRVVDMNLSLSKLVWLSFYLSNPKLLKFWSINLVKKRVSRRGILLIYNHCVSFLGQPMQTARFWI